MARAKISIIGAGNVGATNTERRAQYHRKWNAELGAREGVQRQGHQDHDIGNQDRDQRLAHREAEVSGQDAAQRVGRYANRQTDPQSRDVPTRPSTLFESCRGDILIEA